MHTTALHQGYKRACFSEQVASPSRGDEPANLEILALIHGSFCFEHISYPLLGDRFHPHATDTVDEHKI